jgi:RNA polymerase sigma-70 factor (ECF subfamily)
LGPQDSTLRDLNLEADRQLVRAIAGGSAEALGRLYDRYAGTVFALARRIVALAEDAEEVVQDVFSQVWRDAPRYDFARATVAGWIVMLARTRAIDRLRSRRARPDVNPVAAPEDASIAATSASPEALAISADDVRQVRSALEGLPENQRQLVDLAFFKGLTHTEIAETTGIPLGTVKTRLRTAMMALRGVLGS